MRQAPAKDAAAAPAHPFSEWNLVQYHTGKQRIINRCLKNIGLIPQ